MCDKAILRGGIAGYTHTNNTSNMIKHLGAMHEEKLLEKEKREICNQSKKIKEMKNLFA